MRLGCSSVHLNYLSHHGQPNTQSALRSIQGSLCLGEEIKNPRQYIRRNSDTAVPHAYYNLIGFLFHAKPDVTALGSVFRSVTEQINDYLLKANCIAEYPGGVFRKRYVQSMLPLVDQHACGFHRLLRDAAQV